MKKVPKQASTKEKVVSWLHGSICVIMWLLLIAELVHFILYYIHLIHTGGFYDQESMKMGVYIIIGAFLFLIIYRTPIKKIFKIKDVKKNASHND